MKHVDWYRITCEAYTAIRYRFTISELIALAAKDNPTPVSGDEIARIRNEAQR